MHEDTFFCYNKPVTWAEILGDEQAYHELINICGSPYPRYYEKFKTEIHSYFCGGTLSLPLATALHAPVAEHNPETSTEDIHNENNSADDDMPEEHSNTDIDQDLFE